MRRIDDVDPATWFTVIPQDRTGTTRQSVDGLCIQQTHSRLDLRKQFFSSRVIEPCNRLSSQVKQATLVASFKAKLKEIV